MTTTHMVLWHGELNLTYPVIDDIMVSSLGEKETTRIPWRLHNDLSLLNGNFPLCKLLPNLKP